MKGEEAATEEDLKLAFRMTREMRRHSAPYLLKISNSSMRISREVARRSKGRISSKTKRNLRITEQGADLDSKTEVPIKGQRIDLLP